MAFIFTSRLIANENNDIYMQIFDTKGFDTFSGDLLLSFYENRNKVIFELDGTLKMAESTNDMNELYLILFKLCLYLTNQISTYSPSFGTNFPETNGLKAYLNFLNDSEFVNKNLETSIGLWNKHISLIEYLIMNVSSISKFCEENKQLWVDLDAINILFDIIKSKPSGKFDAYTAIINLVDDNQIEHFEEIQAFQVLLIERLKRFDQEFRSENFKRSKRQIFENNIVISFNTEIALDLNKDKEFQAFIQKFINDEAKYQDLDESEFNTLNICKKIKWNINDGLKNNTEELNVPTDKFNEKHIMISYNMASRDLCKSVKDELEKRGCKLWMDVSDLPGPSLDSMAKGMLSIIYMRFKKLIKLIN